MINNRSAQYSTVNHRTTPQLRGPWRLPALLRRLAHPSQLLVPTCHLPPAKSMSLASPKQPRISVHVAFALAGWLLMGLVARAVPTPTCPWPNVVVAHSPVVLSNRPTVVYKSYLPPVASPRQVAQSSLPRRAQPSRNRLLIAIPRKDLRRRPPITQE